MQSTRKKLLKFGASLFAAGTLFAYSSIDVAALEQRHIDAHPRVSEEALRELYDIWRNYDDTAWARYGDLADREVRASLRDLTPEERAASDRILAIATQVVKENMDVRTLGLTEEELASIAAEYTKIMTSRPMNDGRIFGFYNSHEQLIVSQGSNHVDNFELWVHILFHEFGHLVDRDRGEIRRRGNEGVTESFTRAITGSTIMLHEFEYGIQSQIYDSIVEAIGFENISWYQLFNDRKGNNLESKFEEHISPDVITHIEFQKMFHAARFFFEMGYEEESRSLVETFDAMLNFEARQARLLQENSQYESTLNALERAANAQDELIVERQGLFDEATSERRNFTEEELERIDWLERNILQSGEAIQSHEERLNTIREHMFPRTQQELRADFNQYLLKFEKMARQHLQDMENQAENAEARSPAFKLLLALMGVGAVLFGGDGAAAVLKITKAKKRNHKVWGRLSLSKKAVICLEEYRKNKEEFTQTAGLDDRVLTIIGLTNKALVNIGANPIPAKEINQHTDSLECLAVVLGRAAAQCIDSNEKAQKFSTALERNLDDLLSSNEKTKSRSSKLYLRQSGYRKPPR